MTAGNVRDNLSMRRGIENLEESVGRSNIHNESA